MGGVLQRLCSSVFTSFSILVRLIGKDDSVSEVFLVVCFFDFVFWFFVFCFFLSFFSFF